MWHAQARVEVRGLGLCALVAARAGGGEGGCMLRLNDILLQGGGGGWKLFLSEFTRATSAKHLQRQGYPLLGRACTSEWLPPCSYEHPNRARDS